MNRVLHSATREPVQIGETLIASNGEKYKVERLPQHPDYGLLGYRNEDGDYREIALNKVGLEFEYPHRVHLSEYGGSVLVYEGLTVQVQFTDDSDHEPPWESGDGYGIVSEWTRRDKKPGERILCTDDHDSQRRRYYDWAGSIAKAKAEGWDAPPYKTGTKGQQAVRAVEADFKYHQEWCKDDWRYVVISVECEGEEDACGGFETYKDYHVEAAWEMIEAIVATVKEKRAAENARIATLQATAQHFWDELREYYTDLQLSSADAFLTERKAKFNTLLSAAGLQPIAE